ncbi:hypothetical protein QUB68_22795 [Microcoleus sp. A006_D1]
MSDAKPGEWNRANGEWNRANGIRVYTDETRLRGLKTGRMEFAPT